ncbi:MAG: polyprenyl synthetase family protein [Saprospirales bacterium]|nr:polyprenyl synthetase family protein [Saprospirales bacterium]
MEFIKPFQQAYQDFLDRNPFQKEPRNLYDPADYIMGLGGKRLRPVLLLIGHYLFDENYQPALPAAMAIEVFHNFTLVHDDIMDAAPLRRGKPTVHHKYGVNAGILTGDVMLIQAYQYLLDLDKPQLLPALLGVFNKVAIGVCEGQQLDMDFEKTTLVGIPDYLRMIELKTSVLIAGALKMGALLGGSSIEDATHLYEFGRNMGIAFQLQDDILDAFGDPEKVGKKVGGDIAQHKKTFLYLKAMEVATPTQKSALQQWFDQLVGPEKEEEKIGQVLKLWNEMGIRQFAEKAKDTYQQAAFRALEQVQASPDRKRILEELATELLVRES